MAKQHGSGLDALGPDDKDAIESLVLHDGVLFWPTRGRGALIVRDPINIAEQSSLPRDRVIVFKLNFNGVHDAGQYNLCILTVL